MVLIIYGNKSVTEKISSDMVKTMKVLKFSYPRFVELNVDTTACSPLYLNGTLSHFLLLLLILAMANYEFLNSCH